MLNKLQERVLYYDTDSIVYFSKPGESEIETGSYLGMLANKLNQSERITNFCSTGQKCYVYQTNVKDRQQRIDITYTEDKTKQF